MGATSFEMLSHFACFHGVVHYDAASYVDAENREARQPNRGRPR